MPGGACLERVLIVEDDPDSGEALMGLLSDVGYEVRLVSRPLGATAESLQFKPQVAILGIGTPLMSGYELIAQMRALPELDGCIYIAVTAYGGAEVARLSFQAGFSHHLIKPFAASELLGRLALLRPGSAGQSRVASGAGAAVGAISA